MISSSAIHTYYPPRRLVVRFVLMAVALSALLPGFALVYLLVTGSVNTLTLLLVLGGTVVYFAVGAALSFLFYVTFLRPRLVMSPQGLAYTNRRLTVRASWERVEAIGDRRISPNGLIVEGLILREMTPKPETPGRPDPYGITPNRFVPLVIFNPNWRTTQLGAELQHYAPFLFPT